MLGFMAAPYEKYLQSFSPMPCASPGIIVVGVHVPDILNIRRCGIEFLCCILLCKLCESSGFET